MEKLAFIGYLEGRKEAKRLFFLLQECAILTQKPLKSKGKAQANGARRVTGEKADTTRRQIGSFLRGFTKEL